MAQIKSLDSKLSHKDYAWIKAMENGNTYLILAFAYRIDNWALYSMHPDFNLDGSPEPRDNRYIRRFPFLSEYKSSWCLSIHTSIEQGIRDCELLRRCDIEVMMENIELPFEETSNSLIPLSDSYISLAYKQTSIYRGMQGWHFHHGRHLNEPIKPYRKHRIGVELEVEFNDEDLRDEFIQIPSNWFYRESDGSLDDETGCEIITIPLLPSDAKSIEFWKKLTDELDSRASSWDRATCGLHIHIGKEIAGTTAEQQSETIGKLLYLYHHYLKDSRMNIRIYGRERGYHDVDAKTREGDAAKTLGGDVLRSKAITDKVKKAMIEKSDGHRVGHGNRYFDINLQNTHTIEFRKGKGSINPNRITMIVEYCELMCFYAKSTPWMQISFDDFVAYLKGTASDAIKDIIRATVF